MTTICAKCNEPTEDSEECRVCGADPMLEDRYLLEEKIGQGSSGTTYRALDGEQGRTVAVKELGIHGIESFKAHELFEREADVLCRLDHPGVPEFFDYFETGEGKALRFYLVMEYIDGHTVAEELERRQYSDAQIEELVRNLAEIAEYLHELNPPVVHRDIKPSNVMRRATDDRLVLIDFGSVRDAIEPDEGGSTIAGTIGYMAPEQLRGKASPASDVYGIGATALHLASRAEPEELLGPTNVLEWEDRVDLPPRLTALLDEMLDPDPDRRLADGEAVLEALDDPDFAAVPASSPPPPTSPENDWAGAGTNRDSSRREVRSTASRDTGSSSGGGSKIGVVRIAALFMLGSGLFSGFFFFESAGSGPKKEAGAPTTTSESAGDSNGLDLQEADSLERDELRKQFEADSLERDELRKQFNEESADGIRLEFDEDKIDSNGDPPSREKIVDLSANPEEGFDVDSNENNPFAGAPLEEIADDEDAADFEVEGYEPSTRNRGEESTNPNDVATNAGESGQPDYDDLQRQIREHNAEFTDCVRPPGFEPDSRVSIPLMLTVDGEEVSGVAVDGYKAPASVRGCFLEVARDIEFPGHRGEKTIKIPLEISG